MKNSSTYIDMKGYEFLNIKFRNEHHPSKVRLF